MKLFEPLRLLSGLELTNRVVMAPMPTFAAEADGSVGEAELSYYRRRAEGGVAAIVTAGCAVAERGIAFAGQWRCDDDRFLRGLETTAETIHAGGALAILQLGHAGRIEDCRGERREDQLVQAFGAAAARAKATGFDGVEIHGGHRELLQQFLSPATNRDAARERIPLRVVEAVTKAGPKSIWYRVDPEEPEANGLRFDDVAQFARRLRIDVLDLAAKRYSAPDWGSRLPQFAVMAVGGLETSEQAAQALTDGCSLVGLGHVLLADPDWPNHVEQGLWEPSTEPPSVELLRATETPPPVIDYLVKKGRAHF